MVVLGLNMGHDGAACVVVKGELKAAISRERISRVKKQSGVDLKTIDYVLESQGLTLADVDYVTFAAYNHGESELRIREALNSQPLEGNLWGLPSGKYHQEYLCEV